MNYFHYQDNELYCEQVPVQKIVEQVGTPAYIYSHETLQRHFQAFESALSPIKHLLCYAVKTNSNIAILNLLARWGAGMDIVSGGELYRALQAGTAPNKIVYAGVGKTADEITFALQSGILMFNVESRPELELINKIAGDLGRTAPVALRINPDVDPLTHPYISTGLKKNKFGISFKLAADEFKAAAQLPHIEVVGIHNHIGSQITSVGPYMESVNKIVELAQQLRKNGVDIRYLNLGGGLGITYNEETPPSPQQLAETLLPILKPLSDCTVIMEPGRSIAGNSGILVAKVLYCKQGDEKNFTIVDAGMNDLVRPSLYNAYHHIQPLYNKERGEWVTDVVGPICESGDFLAKDRKLSKMEAGEFMAVMSAGSYGFSMSSNYNSRPRAVEVLVKGDKFQVIRKRESYNDLILGETIPEL